MLEFRPHHFLCTLGFQGKGYSDDFVRNFQKIADQLRAPQDPAIEGDRLPIRVVQGTDHVCGPCPNRREKLCVTEEKIQKLDRAHARILELNENDVLTWGEAKERIAEKMTPELFESACEPCGWKELGVCRTALLELRDQKRKPKAIASSSKLSAWVSILLTGAALTAGFSMSPSALAAPSKPKKKKTAVAALAPPAPLPIEEIRKKKPKRSKKAKAIHQALDLIKEGRYSQARKILQPISQDELFADYAHSLTAQSYREEAIQELQEKNPAEALAHAQKALSLYLKIGSHHPYSPTSRKLPEELAQTEIVIAQANFAKDRFRTAQQTYERAFQRLASMNGLNRLRPVSIEQYAETCAEAASLLCPNWIQRFVQMYPKGSEEFKAIEDLLPESAQKLRPAGSYSKLTQTYKAPDLDVTAFEAAMGLHTEGETKDAIKAFGQFIDEFPKSSLRFRARYWLASNLERRGDREKAQKVYEELFEETPLSYYGLLAATALGKDLNSLIAPASPEAAATDLLLQPHEVIRLKRAEAFLTEGVHDLAQQELREFRARGDLSTPFLFYLAMLNNEAGSHHSAFLVLNDLIQRGESSIRSSFGLHLIFPVAYYDLIHKFSALNKLDPILVLSLIKQESAFDHSAGSHVGASGLMQLMPATARDMEKDVQRADLIDSETNVRIGTRYLAWLLKRYNGNFVYALAGYNAGPGSVDRWIKSTASKQLGMLEFIESIPYRETRDYVSSIMRNYFWYSRKLTGEFPKSPEIFWNTYGPQIPEAPVFMPDVAGVALASFEPKTKLVPMPVPSASPEPVPTPIPSPTPRPSEELDRAALESVLKPSLSPSPSPKRKVAPLKKDSSRSIKDKETGETSPGPR